MTAAAFFDLDRTLLLSASGTVFSQHLETAGVSTAAKVPGAGLAIAVFDLLGETRLNMELTKQLVRATKGWDVEAVTSAASSAAVELAALVPPFARQLIEQHRQNGVKLVIATTSPTVLVEPFAAALGFDAVVATKWANDGEKYLGETEAGFIWGSAKRDAVVQWATQNSVSLESSFAYSDSYYDTPMLAAVGHAVAVNPDIRLAGVAALHEWPIRNFDKPEGVLKFAGLELQELARPLVRTELFPTVQWSFEGLENVPEGPVILAFNHRSYFDSAVMVLLSAKIGRPARFLAKKEIFDIPLLSTVARLAGTVSVDRDTGASDAVNTAITGLQAGEMVLIAPQGTIPRGAEFFDPVLHGRPGVIRLAVASGAKIVPVGIWGSENVWPRNERVPFFNIFDRKKVRVVVGEPVAIDGADEVAQTEQVMAAIVDLLPDEAREHVEPTPEELAKTFPHGHVPEAS